MNFCPACGAPNDDNAKFCVECKTRLLGASRVAPVGAGGPAIRPPAPGTTAIEAPGKGLAIASALTGLVGLGPLAIALGWLAIRRRSPGREFAIAGLALGSLGTIILIVLALSSLGRGDPLARMTVTPDNLGDFARAVTARCERIEEDADALRRRLGPGGEAEVTTCYAMINSIREDLFEMVELDDPDDLAEMKEQVMDKLHRARASIAGR
ncbi:zinc-ribbon domain-containing protein [candidate division WOR-3 bacterium]|nr:zinc-ribbon domain-containing protein [candidate division WOR-3 bacterium]